MHDDEPEQETSALFLAGGATLFYGLMAAGALGLMVWFDIDVAATIFGGPETNPLVAATIGAAVGFVIVWLSHIARNAGPMRTLKREFATTIGRQNDLTIFVVALTSAIGEELLFRGALQPLIGLWPTVLVFGLLHGGGLRRLWAWTVFATFGGVVFAYLTLATGSLLAAIVMHFTVNYFNLVALTRSLADDDGDRA